MLDLKIEENENSDNQSLMAGLGASSLIIVDLATPAVLNAGGTHACCCSCCCPCCSCCAAAVVQPEVI